MTPEQVSELRRLIADWQQRRLTAIHVPPPDDIEAWQRYLISCAETLKAIADLLEGDDDDQRP